MKIYNKITKFSLITITIAICQIFYDTSVLAALYDITSGQEQESIREWNLSNSLDSFTTPRWGEVAPNSFSEQEKEHRKAKYRFVINLIERKQFVEAGNKITFFLKQSPDDAHLYNLQALLNISEGNKVLAKQSYQKAIKLDPDNSVAYLGMADLAFVDEQLDKAREYADKLLAIDEKNKFAYFQLARIANKQGDKLEVEQVLLAGYKNVQGNINSEVQFIMLLSKIHAFQKQPEKSLHLAQDLVKRYPDNTKALSILAGNQIVNRQNDLAEQTLLKIIHREKSDTKHRILLANLLLSKQPEREQEAFKLLDEAFKINPANPRPLILKLTYYFKLKQYKQALDVANNIDQLFPGLAIGKQLKIEIYLAENKFDKAIETLKQVYQIKPDIKVLLVTAELMINQGKQADAIDMLKQESEKNNDNIAKTINLKLATIYQQQGNYKQAEKYYQAILVEQHDNVLALNNLALIYAQHHNPKAIELAAQAYGKAPKSAIVADTYGYILVKHGEVKKGLKILQEAANAAPHAGDIQYHLAKAYSLSGDKQKAIAILELLNKETEPFQEKENSKQLLLKLKS